MPMYEYRCQACGESYEELVSRSTPDQELSCPSCGERASKRLLSTFSAGRSGGSASLGGSSQEGGCAPGG